MKQLIDLLVPTAFGKIHAIQSNTEARGTPIIFIPGMLGKAEDWVNDLKSFPNHPCIAISLRGRGKSDFPDAGYSVYDHTEDIQAVVDHLKISRFILVGASQGALYAVAYAVKYPQKVSALVLQDKVLKQKKFGSEWVNKAKNHPSIRNEDFLWNIANDSRDLNLLEEAQPLEDTPTLLIKGGNSAMVMEEDLLEMKEVLKQAKVKIFPESGHDVSSPNYNLYIATLDTFFRSIPGNH